MSKYCPKCGNELPDDAQFCNECGYSVLVDDNSPVKETPKKVQKTEETENSKKDMYFMAEMSDTPVVECLTRDELGWAIGKAKRTAVVVLDNSFANMINKNI